MNLLFFPPDSLLRLFLLINCVCGLHCNFVCVDWWRFVSYRRIASPMPSRSRRRGTPADWPQCRPGSGRRRRRTPCGKSSFRRTAPASSPEPCRRPGSLPRGTSTSASASPSSLTRAKRGVSFIGTGAGKLFGFFFRISFWIDGDCWFVMTWSLLWICIN